MSSTEYGARAGELADLGASAERKSSSSSNPTGCLWAGVISPFLLDGDRLASADASLPHLIGVRNDTGWLAEPVRDNAGRVWLCATPDEWEAFVAAVKRGEFDLMPHTRLLVAMEVSAPVEVVDVEIVDDRIPGEVTLDAALADPEIVAVQRGVVPDPPYADDTSYD